MSMKIECNGDTRDTLNFEPPRRWCWSAGVVALLVAGGCAPQHGDAERVGDVSQPVTDR